MAAATSEHPNELPGARARILVVDDDGDVRGAISSLLEDEGYEVDACADGQRAWERLHAPPVPDLMILDLMLPGMDGWQLRTRQRADPQLRDIPVLAISADGSFKAAAIHADAFLPKPVGASKLLAEVARILRERSGAAAAASGQLEQLHRLALLGTLTANIEHQLRNPLAFLLTNARLAAESLPELKAAVAAGTAPMRALDDVGGMIDDARAGAERIHAIVEAMGIMARGPGVGTGKASLDVVLDAAVHLCSGHLRHHVQLERAVPPGLEVAGEEPRLLQVLLCLVLTHPVAARTEPSARLDFHLAVRREGGAVQVDVEARPHSEFTPPVVLATVRPTVEARQAEAAVGLAVCRTLVERFGGCIESTSASTVRLTLPLAS